MGLWEIHEEVLKLHKWQSFIFYFFSLVGNGQRVKILKDGCCMMSLSMLLSQATSRDALVVDVWDSECGSVRGPCAFISL